MVFSAVYWKGNQLNVPLGKFWCQLCSSARLCGTYWHEVLRVKEENALWVSQTAVEMDAADGYIGLDVGGLVPQKETSGCGSSGDAEEPSPRDLMKTLNYRSSLLPCTPYLWFLQNYCFHRFWARGVLNVGGLPPCTEHTINFQPGPKGSFSL